ncbi:MAG TPA: rod shape-determining protein MreC [Gemmatimonadales bacterium]|nr:rod shape-determining protein MreC [Gemmatimonadales bacterium]
MSSASERSYTRRDTVMFLVCVGMSLVALFSPVGLGLAVSEALRSTVLAPLVWLQARAEEGRTSRARLHAITIQRDSTSYIAQGLPSLIAENERLRQLLSLSRRLSTPYVAAEVLHQTQATDGRTLLLDVGTRNGVAEFDPVVAPEGLIGVVLNATERSSVVMTWAHPEFRVSAFTVTGNASGVVAPSLLTTGDGALEFRGVPYRDSVPPGTLVLSSGLGGVYPKGIPVGIVTGVIREQTGWERVYRLRPAANPGSAAHVLVLVTPPDADLARAFPSDSALEAMRLDSIARVRRADSLADAERLARAARAESLAAVRRDTTVAAPPRRPAPAAPTARPVPPANPRPAAPAAPSPVPGVPSQKPAAPIQAPATTPSPPPATPKPAAGDSAR